MALDTVIKVSAKKASEMIKNMYPTAKARRATDEETEYVIGKEIIATYNVLDGKLNYKFKDIKEKKMNNLEKALKVLREETDPIFDEVIKDIADDTNDNDHTNAYKSGIKLLKSYVKDDEDTKKLDNLMKDAKNPNRNYDKLFDIAKKVLSKDEYKKFNAAF